MVAPSSTLRLVTFSSILTLCLCAAAPARADGGAGGTSNGGGAGTSSGGTTAGGSGGSGGGSGATSDTGGTSSGGASAQGGQTAAAGTSSSAGSGGVGGASSNLVTNSTFDSGVKDPWWSFASNSDADNPADVTLAVTDGRLCGTMTTGAGKNVWDVGIGLSGVALVKDQYYHISFSVSADVPRTIKFKTGFGDTPYTDYFIKPVPVTATPQKIEYTYLNLRDDPKAQFQFQIGKWGANGQGVGTVCLDDIVIEPVPAPLTPTYTTSAASGHPFKDYKSFLKMGTAVDTPIFLSNPLHNAIVATEFAMITPANSMKMNLIQPAKDTFDFTDTDALVAWAQAKGLEFRGHPLVWHTQAPSWLTSPSVPFTRDEMIAIMYKHIDTLMGRYKGKFPYWDVVNEAIDGTDWRQTFWFKTIGPDFMDLAFIHAHMVDPDAKLYYNDYNIEQMGNPKADKVFAVVSDMKARGIPIDGIGLQGHYYVEPNGETATGVPNMQAIRDNMARYGALGFDVQITESDFRIGKPLDANKTELQKKFYADLLQACIDEAKCSHFTLWGLSDLDSWVPSTFPDYDYAHIFDSNLMPKPAYGAMSQVFAQFNTDGSPIKPVGAGGAAPVASSPSSSGGCSLAPRTSSSAPWLLTAFAMVGALVSRRRSKRSGS